jgi:hypothetical protein
MIPRISFRSVALAIALLIACSFVVLGQTTLEPEAKFPFSEGTYWTYRGIVRWTHENSNKVSETPVVWKMEVRKNIRRENMLAAVVNGFPTDLDWSDGHPTPADSLIVQSGGGKFYLIGSEQLDSVVKTLQDPNASLTSFLSEDDIFLVFPLTRGKKFCDPGGMTRSDSHYCWVVESVDRVSLSNVKGIRSASRTAYGIRYQTNPDDTEFTFVPGVGIVAYGYHHHGTTADTELRLVEFHQGANP